MTTLDDETVLRAAEHLYRSLHGRERYGETWQSRYRSGKAGEYLKAARQVLAMSRCVSR